MFIRKNDSRIFRLATKILPVAPAAHVFQMTQSRKIRVGQDHGLHSIWRKYGRMGGDDRSEAMPHDPGTIGPDLIHQREDIGRMIGRCVPRGCDLAVAMPSQVKGGDAIIGGKRLHGPAKEPDRKITRDPVNQNHIRPFTGLLNVKPEPIDRSVWHRIGLRSIVEVSGQERGKFTHRQIAILASAKLGHQFSERKWSAIVCLECFPENHRVDRREAEVGEKPSFGTNGIGVFSSLEI